MPSEAAILSGSDSLLKKAIYYKYVNEGTTFVCLLLLGPITTRDSCSPGTFLPGLSQVVFPLLCSSHLTEEKFFRVSDSNISIIFNCFKLSGCSARTRHILTGDSLGIFGVKIVDAFFLSGDIFFHLKTKI